MRAALMPPVSERRDCAMTATSRIIVLNGNSSAGKSSVARALQTIAIEPFLHVPIDAFLDMMPQSQCKGPGGLVFTPGMEDGKPVCAITVGPAAKRTLGGTRRAVATMTAAGNNLIVEDAISDDDAASYAKALAAHHVSWVGVFAPLDVPEERERRRGACEVGLARWLFNRVHGGVGYHLEIDTSGASAMECAAQIKLAFSP